MAPTPNAAEKIATMIPSRIAFVNNMDGSPASPSCRGPMTAMAPMQMVRVVITKPSMNMESFSRPARFRSQSPKTTNRFSMFIHSPKTAPAARDTAHSMVPPEVSAAPSIESIFSRAPAIPINMTARPMACMMVS